MSEGQVIDAPCDICWYTGKTSEQKVKKVNEHGLMLCKPCYLSMEQIERK